MAGPFTLAPLPWAEDALAPTISAKTIGFHYHKHHQTYVDTLNKLVMGTRFAKMPLEEVVRATVNGKDKEQKIFNNVGQVWNHDFFWRSLTSKGGKPGGRLKDAIERDFGGVEELTKLPSHRRCVGARLLSRLPERPREIPPGSAWKAAELGIRGGKSREGRPSHPRCRLAAPDRAPRAAIARICAACSRLRVLYSLSEQLWRDEWRTAPTSKFWSR